MKSENKLSLKVITYIKGFRNYIQEYEVREDDFIIVKSYTNNFKLAVNFTNDNFKLPLAHYYIDNSGFYHNKK